MKMKRFLIAALALLIAFAPSLPLHTASADTQITYVYVKDIDAPVAGEKPDYSATAEYNDGKWMIEDYNKGNWSHGLIWYDTTAKRYLAPADTFIEGHVYKVEISLVTVGAYDFYASAAAYVNLKDAKLETFYNKDNIGITYTFPAAKGATKISTVIITGVTAPVAGAKPVFSASTNATAYQIQNYNSTSYHNGVLWHDETAGGNLGADDTFVAGHTYKVNVCVEPKSGYAFTNATTGTINGNATTSKTIYGDGTATFNYIFPAAGSQTITSVTITGVTAPVAGQKPNYNVTVKGEGFTVEDYNDNDWVHGVVWHDMADGESDNMKPDDTFKAGHTYRIGISLQPKEGYTFKNSSGDVVASGTINGKAVSGTEPYSDGTCAFRFVFPAVEEAKTPIPAVDIAIKPPYSLHTPSYSATVTGEGVVLNDYTFMDNVTKWEHGVNWYDRTNNSSLGCMGLDATFVQLNYYTVNVMVKAAAGYGFTTDTKVTVNGQEGEISISGDNATCSFDFPFCIPEPVNIQVTVTEPVAGEKPSYEYTVSGEGGGVMDYNENGYVHGVLWHDQTEDKDMTPSDVFVAGHKYKVKVASYIADGYYADRMHGSFSINGQGSPYYGIEAVFECKASPHLFPVDYYGFAEYEGGLFIVYQGDVVTSLNGLVQDPNHPETWYFCSNGQAQLQYTGLAEYGGEWFYVDKGVCDVNRVGAVEYNGGTFIVAAGRWIQEYTGLIQDPNTGIWYFVVGGQVQTGYTGLAQYDGAWFYLINGVLAVDYTGPVVYDGSTFNVVNGQVA